MSAPTATEASSPMMSFTTPMYNPADIRQQEAHAAKNVNAILIWTVGMFCIMCWDWLLYLPKEISRIWRRKFTLKSYIYILNRYFGILQFALVIPLLSTHYTSAFCNHLIHWQNTCASLSILMTQVILVLHTAQKYRRAWVVYSVLGLFIAASFAITLWVAGDQWAQIQPLDFSDKVWPCLAIDWHEMIITAYFMHLWVYVLNLVLFVCNPTGTTNPPINCFKHPIKSGLLYIVAITLMNLANALVLALAEPTIQWVNTPATNMLGIVLSCKLVLDEQGRVRDDNRRVAGRGYGELEESKATGMTGVTMTTIVEPHRESMVSAVSA